MLFLDLLFLLLRYLVVFSVNVFVVVVRYVCCVLCMVGVGDG